MPATPTSTNASSATSVTQTPPGMGCAIPGELPPIIWPIIPWTLPPFIWYEPRYQATRNTRPTIDAPRTSKNNSVFHNLLLARRRALGIYPLATIPKVETVAPGLKYLRSPAWGVIVAVGTRNPAKIEGIRRGFLRYFRDTEFRSVDSSSVARAQPLGLEQMVEGAVARAKFALSRVGGDYGVGVEAGIFKIGTFYFDHQQAAIVDPSGKVSLGHSAGYMLPKDAIDRMLKDGEELERWAERLSGVSEIGDKGGLVNHLTKGEMTRVDLTEQCVMMALSPWLHRDVYDL